jgi:glyoxylase-like metal-dependent hydrolase (beta-lactamase superfamily II)
MAGFIGLTVSGQLIQAQMPAPADTEVKIIPLSDNLHVLMGLGGNIAVCSGPDGVFIIDDDLKPMTAKIAAAIATISKDDVSMVFNTHWHFDHSGGNEYFGEAGATIVAHDNVRARMSTTQQSSFFGTETPPSPAAALPVFTFDNTATFYLNDMKIKAIHVVPAHTDGDAIFIFEEANVVHLGDVFFNGLYPFIDISSGGSVAGMIAAVDTIMPMLNEDTVIIPGHGPVATLEDLRNYRSMLMLVSARIQALIEDGKTREEAIALNPTINFDQNWAWQFLSGDRWAGLIYDSLVASGSGSGSGSGATAAGESDSVPAAVTE